MVAGFALSAAVALLLWTITPSAEGGPEPFLRSATATYLLGHFGDLSIGTAQLTITPVLLSVLFGLLLAVGPGRGRITGGTARGEAISIGAGAVSYAVLVTALAVALRPAGATGVVGLWALLLAVTSLTVGMLWRGRELRSLVVGALPPWARTGLRAAGVALLVLVGGGALAVAGALVLAFGTVAELSDSITHSTGDGIGLALAGLAYLPNAIVAGIGYVMGVGFEVGAGSYSPFGSVLVDLPPFPILAAVPSHAGPSPLGLVLLVVPLGAGLAAALVTVRGVAERSSRLFAVLIAAGAAGAAAGVAVWLAGGGVVGGPWPQLGASGWKVGLVVGLAVLVIAGTWVLAAGYRTAAAEAVRVTGSRRGRRQRSVVLDPAADSGTAVNEPAADAETAAEPADHDAAAPGADEPNGDEAIAVESGPDDAGGDDGVDDGQTAADDAGTEAAGADLTEDDVTKPETETDTHIDTDIDPTDSGELDPSSQDDGPGDADTSGETAAADADADVSAGTGLSADVERATTGGDTAPNDHEDPAEPDPQPAAESDRDTRRGE